MSKITRNFEVKVSASEAEISALTCLSSEPRSEVDVHHNGVTQKSNSNLTSSRPPLSFTPGSQHNLSGMTTLSDDSQATLRTRTTSQRYLHSINESSKTKYIGDDSDDDDDDDDDDTDEAESEDESKEEDEEYESEYEEEGNTNDAYQNEENFTGLHKLCYIAEGEEDPVWDKVVTCLKRKNPAEAIEAVATEQKGVIPLFIACERQPPVKAVNALIDAFPETLKFTDEQDFRPLHIACSHDANEEVIQIMIEKDADPKRAKEALTEARATPLHLIMYENNCKPPSSSLFRTLITPQVMKIQDQYGNTPTQLMFQYIERIELSDGIDSLTVEKHCKEVLDEYLNLRPQGTFELLKKMKSFPPRIYQHILQNTFIKRTLNDRVSQRLPTLILTLDILIQIIIISAFTQVMGSNTETSNEHKTIGTDEPSVFSTNMVLIIVGIVYKTLRTLMQSSFCFFNIRNLLSISQILFVIISLVLLRKGDSYIGYTRPNLAHQVVFTATGALIWIMLISILQLAFLSFSVFTSITNNIIYILFPSISAIFCVIGAFSLTFFTIMRTSYDGINACSQMDATTDETIDTDVSFCTYSGSFVHVYNMFVGEKEVVQFTGGPMLILSPIFSFLVVVLFFNIMIAIVHRAYVELGSREEDLFWSRRLDFLTELNNCVDSIRNKVSGVCCSKPQIEEQYHTTKDDYSIESDLDGSVRSFRKSGTSIDAKRTNSLNHSWDVLYSSFSHQTVSKEWEVKERRLYDKGGAVHRKILETPLLFRRIIAMCIFPIWILLGVLTLGLLWPTQIRELLFGAPLSRNDYRQIKQNTRERNVVNDQVMSMNERMQKMQDEVTGLKNDIGNMRLEIISEMNSFKQILLTSSAPRGTLYNPHTPQTPKTSHTMAQSPYYYHPYASQATNTSQYAPQSPHQYHPYNSTPRSGPSIISQSNTKTAASPPFQI